MVAAEWEDSSSPGGGKVQGGVGVGKPHAHLALVAAAALLRVLPLRVVPAHRQGVVAAACNLQPSCTLQSNMTNNTRTISPSLSLQIRAVADTRLLGCYRGHISRAAGLQRSAGIVQAPQQADNHALVRKALIFRDQGASHCL